MGIGDGAARAGGDGTRVGLHRNAACPERNSRVLQISQPNAQAAEEGAHAGDGSVIRAERLRGRGLHDPVRSCQNAP